MHALIAGGGVAGPVAAMALQRVGIEATVFEAYPVADPDVGSYFTVTANGLTALAEVGALDLALEAGFPTRRNVLWNHAGRRLAELSLDSQVPGSPPAHTMKRSRLARLLQDEALRRGIKVEYNRRLSGSDVGPDGRVIARFEDDSTENGDLLIGADGVHSVVRRIIDPRAPGGRYVGLTNFGGVTRGAADGIKPQAWHLIFGRNAFFGYAATPAGDVVWFANLPRPMITPEERASTDVEEWKTRLVDQFADDAGPAVDLIKAGKLELTADNTHDLGHVPTWHRGPYVIIGDAAHAPAPTSGQGGSMAIEDAVVLARCLREQDSIPVAFADYERQRRERVEKIVAFGARGSSHKAPGPFGRFARDLILPVLFRFVITEKSLAWMYDYRVALQQPYQFTAASTLLGVNTLEVLLGIGAVGGAVGIVQGDILGDAVDRLPFGSALFAGLALFIINGLYPLAVVIGSLRHQQWVRWGHVVVGLALIGWITVQVAYLGPPVHWLQVLYFAWGLVIATIGWRLRLRDDRSLPAT